MRAIGSAGVAPKCKLMVLKITGDYWNHRYVNMGDVLDSMDYAAENGAKVVNCSFAFDGKSSAMETMLNSMGDLGALVVASAGNDGVDIGQSANFVSPAVYAQSLDNVISVAGVFASDQLCNGSTACSYATNYSSSCVSLAAPGYQMWSTDRVLGSSTGYTLFGDTSAAAPLVSGVAAMVFEQNPSWTPAQVKAKIMGTVRTVSGLSSYTISGGVIDAAAAVEP